MHAIHRPKFIIKIDEYFYWINQFISRVQNFISLNLKEKSMRYAFFPLTVSNKIKIPQSIIPAGGHAWRDLSVVSKG
jgi:hypothetical protein